MARKKSGLLTVRQELIEELKDLCSTFLDSHVEHKISLVGERLHIDLVWAVGSGFMFPQTHADKSLALTALKHWIKLFFAGTEDRVISGYKMQWEMDQKSRPPRIKMHTRISYLLTGDRADRILNRVLTRVSALHVLSIFIAASAEVVGITISRPLNVWTGLERPELWGQEHAFQPVLMWLEEVPGKTQNTVQGLCLQRQEYLKQTLGLPGHCEFQLSPVFGDHARARWFIWTNETELENVILPNLALPAGKQTMVDWGTLKI